MAIEINGAGAKCSYSLQWFTYVHKCSDKYTRNKFYIFMNSYSRFHLLAQCWIFKWTQIDIHSKYNLNTEYTYIQNVKKVEGPMEFRNFAFAVSLYFILIFRDKVDNMNYTYICHWRIGLQKHHLLVIPFGNDCIFGILRIPEVFKRFYKEITFNIVLFVTCYLLLVMLYCVAVSSPVFVLLVSIAIFFPIHAHSK